MVSSLSYTISHIFAIVKLKITNSSNSKDL